MLPELLDVNANLVVRRILLNIYLQRFLLLNTKLFDYKSLIEICVFQQRMLKAIVDKSVKGITHSDRHCVVAQHQRQRLIFLRAESELMYNNRLTAVHRRQI